MQLCDERDKMRMGLGGSRDVRTVKRNQQIRVQAKVLKEGRPKLRAMIEKEKAKKKVRAGTGGWLPSVAQVAAPQ